MNAPPHSNTNPQRNHPTSHTHPQGGGAFILLVVFCIRYMIDAGRYSGVKNCYLAGDTVLVNCDLLQLSGILSGEQTRQLALGIPAIPRSTTSVNHVSNTKNNQQNERPAP